MKARVKIFLLFLLKFIGLFFIAKQMTKKGLRILCYHGISFDDEHKLWPEIFITQDTFRRRIDFLVKNNYPVIPLEEALSLLDENSLPSCSVVITFDDGFYSVFHHAAPILLENDLTCTIYITSYYCTKQNPVFRLAVQYMFWKTQKNELDLSDFKFTSDQSVSLLDKHKRDQITWEIINFSESQLEENERYQMAKQLGEKLGVAYNDISKNRLFSIMSTEEIIRLSQDNMDIQLHSHRHNLPEDGYSIKREIHDNRLVLAPLVNKPLRHFCYPSGLWSQKHFNALNKDGIISATTCDTGYNYLNTPRLALKRILDGQHISNIEFEAELCGMMELLRRLKSSAKKLFQ